jgi:hypothetical protein
MSTAKSSWRWQMHMAASAADNGLGTALTMHVSIHIALRATCSKHASALSALSSSLWVCMRTPLGIAVQGCVHAISRTARTLSLLTPCGVMSLPTPCGVTSLLTPCGVTP